MRKRTIVILAFLLALYIAPMILVPSSSHVAILAEPNMNKEFSAAEYGDESPQSITSFSETLEDDVLFFPENESHGSGYAESFADISDWSTWTGSAISTDGDIIRCENSAAGAGTLYGALHTFSVPESWVGKYLEGRLRLNTTAGISYAQILLYNAAWGGIGGIGFAPSTSFATTKSILTVNQDAKYLGINCVVSGAIALSIYVDYLRISPSNELGWQHDGSTTAGISSPSGDSISTDADIWELEVDADGGEFEILVDNTTTKSTVESDYYQFLKIDIVSLEGNGWTLEGYDVSYRVIEETFSTATGIMYYNIKALGYDFSKYRITLEETTTIRIDFIKAYSIANFTYTGSGVSIDDYLYVSTNVLYCSGTSFTSIILDHDPALANTYYAGWNMSTSQGTPQIDFYVGAWLGYSSATSGELPLGTLTDTRVKFTASANIISIKFIDLHDWHIIGTAILWFETPNWHIIATAILTFWTAVDTTYLDWLLIFLGLIMIPASTLYLVKGGKDEMSANKFFYFVVAFMLGWGLLLGGIM